VSAAPAPAAPPGWHGRLQIDYRRDGERTVALDRHDGPLRVLQRLYPEGPGICHHVLVHPPGGLVGGDRLDVALTLGEGTHALLTTPGAARFYRSEGAPALQDVQARLAPGARLEWLPLETIAYPGCIATNRLRLQLDGDAETIAWDLLALGLPAADQAFDRGTLRTHIELPGRWLDAGRIDGQDRRLLQSRLGFAGRTVLATLWFAAGAALPTARREALLDAARAVASDESIACGVTAPEAGIVVARALAHRVEPAMQWAAAVRAAWRSAAWGLAAEPPRVWRT
jgi:urease accessory protein